MSIDPKRIKKILKEFKEKRLMVQLRYDAELSYLDDVISILEELLPQPKKAPGRANGGLARAKALSPEQRKEIAKVAAKARWSGKDGHG